MTSVGVCVSVCLMCGLYYMFFVAVIVIIVTDVLVHYSLFLPY